MRHRLIRTLIAAGLVAAPFSLAPVSAEETEASRSSVTTGSSTTSTTSTSSGTSTSSHVDADGVTTTRTTSSFDFGQGTPRHITIDGESFTAALCLGRTAAPQRNARTAAPVLLTVRNDSTADVRTALADGSSVGRMLAAGEHFTRSLAGGSQMRFYAGDRCLVAVRGDAGELHVEFSDLP